MVSRYDLEMSHRRSLRLNGYDYSRAGAYFVTICAHQRECLFGDVCEDEMVLNPAGEIVREEWLRSSAIRAEIRLGEFVIMPNHFHGIVHIVDIGMGDRPVAPTRSRVHGPKSKSIGALVAGFKSAVTVRVNQLRNNRGAPVWQRNYYEHVIRDEDDYNRIAEYVANNPLRWTEDSLNPST